MKGGNASNCMVVLMGVGRRDRGKASLDFENFSKKSLFF